ncbi:hypothetical protein KGA66_12000 [Actinocrinis puniceicyclus]|uniref:Uncharacterized protein n=1 Tax=Actinocrinis puniceicyclus TaxID=977794 RepID=A0A8J7WK66_9ACTN|nr:hypothetical protein [Actinocrinis puniceicyclus]MBS2963776.1 hypothetical protein [Actinocrinis puniceicyclus]
MYLINSRLTAEDSCISADDLRRLLTDIADPGDCLEHLYAETDPREARLALFLCHPDLAAAESAAAQLCMRALKTCPELRGWSMQYCGAGVVPGAEKILLGV